MRYVFSYGSKWMSEAPFLMASSSTLLTKRTIGASSTSSRPTVSFSRSSSPPVTSRFSRSRSSSASAGICVSTCSIALVPMRCSLSSSTTTASIDRPVWNLISSSACRLVGSETATNSRLPRLTSGSTRCLASSLSETSLTVSRSGWIASRSSSGTPNSCEAAMAISRAIRQVVRHQVRDQVGVGFLGRGHRHLHGLLVQQAVLDEAQRQALQGVALRVDGWDDVVGHGVLRVSRRQCGATNYRSLRWQAIVKLPGILQHNA